MYDSREREDAGMAASFVVGDRVALHFKSEVNSHNFFVGFPNSLSKDGTPYQ
jgi:hypothetical protein